MPESHIKCQNPRQDLELSAKSQIKCRAILLKLLIRNLTVKCKTTADPSTNELEKSLAAHEHLWKSYQNDLAHYYRYLYNIIRFINESDVNKIRYIRILRAQLSDFELLVLFYNGLFPLAAKFKEYVEFFTLFDNLPKNLLFDRSHDKFYDPRAFDEKARKKTLSFKDAVT